MRKLIIAAALMCSVALSAQTTEKQVILSRKNYDDFTELTSRNVFRFLGDVPETATEVYAGTVLQYTRVNGSECTWDIMPDGEYRFKRKDDNRIYYLRLIDGVLFGYSMLPKKDGSYYVEYYQNKKVVHTDTVKIDKNGK